jgi:putative membrane protein
VSTVERLTTKSKTISSLRSWRLCGENLIFDKNASLERNNGIMLLGGDKMIFLIHWLITTIAILISAYLLPGVTVKGFFAALVTALVLGLINTFIRPILLILTLPINILTLGLFTFVINALLILLTSAVVPGFYVRNFWWALLFSFVLSLIKWALNAIAPV